MLSSVAISCAYFLFNTVTSIAADEESLRLAWAVRRLVVNSGNCNLTNLCGNCKPGDEEIQTKLDKTEETIARMKYLYPEAFCLLGMKSGQIPNSAISASSDHGSEYCEIVNSRLDRYGGWCAGANNPPDQWIEVDLGKIRKVTGVVSQGAIYTRALYEWVTGFKIEYGTTSGSRRSILENGSTKIFTPVNFDPTTKVVTRFPAAILARYVRIIPTAFHGHISMRFDLIDC